MRRPYRSGGHESPRRVPGRATDRAEVGRADHSEARVASRSSAVRQRPRAGPSTRRARVTGQRSGQPTCRPRRRLPRRARPRGCRCRPSRVTPDRDHHARACRCTGARGPCTADRTTRTRASRSAARRRDNTCTGADARCSRTPATPVRRRANRTRSAAESGVGLRLAAERLLAHVADAEHPVVRVDAGQRRPRRSGQLRRAASASEQRHGPPPSGGRARRRPEEDAARRCHRGIRAPDGWLPRRGASSELGEAPWASDPGCRARPDAEPLLMLRGEGYRARPTRRRP